MAERSSSAAILEVKGLNVFYGASHALQGVDLSLGHGVLVGRRQKRHGQDHAVPGHHGPGAGEFRVDHGSTVKALPTGSRRKSPALGIGYVPQGRRLWRSLTVDEHLRMVSPPVMTAPGQIDRIYSTSPGWLNARTMAAAQLSGGEQQMLAISRALLLNPRLLVMDEPTEGLAPVIVSQVEPKC